MAIEVFGRLGSMIDTVLNWFANLPWWAQLLVFLVIIFIVFWVYRMRIRVD